MTSALTRVGLVTIRRRINVYLRFGKPSIVKPTNPQCRQAFFAPGEVFCRVWWERNTYGTTRWQLAILQAMAPHQVVQTIVGIAPGATILLAADGARAVKSALRLIGRVEAQGIAPSNVAPTYWRVAQNRLAGRAEIGFYGTDRHAAETLRWPLR